MKWHHEHDTRSKKSDAVTWDDDPLNDDEEKGLEDGITSRLQQPWPMPSKEERAWTASFAPTTRTIPRVNQPPVVMKPVPKEVQKFLFQGECTNLKQAKLRVLHRFKHSKIKNVPNIMLKKEKYQVKK